jgi:hypothetical protein
MQEFNVPQFIDVENRIVGQITVRQFLILLVSGIIIVVFYRLVTFNIFIVLALLVGFLAALFAFVKVNGQPFHLFSINVLETLGRPSLRLWGKELEEIRVAEKKEKHVVEALPRRTIPTPSRISELSLLVDTGGIYEGEGEVNPSLS